MSDLQSLFAALTEERDRLRAETGAADAARSAAERSVLSLRSEQAALAQRLQPARASLGNASRQMELLRARAAGLGGQIRAEGAEVRRLAGALAELEADGTAARRASVEELEALGGELEHAMGSRWTWFSALAVCQAAWLPGGVPSRSAVSTRVAAPR